MAIWDKLLRKKSTPDDPRAGSRICLGWTIGFELGQLLSHVTDPIEDLCDTFGDGVPQDLPTTLSGKAVLCSGLLEGSLAMPEFANSLRMVTPMLPRPGRLDAEQRAQRGHQRTLIAALLSRVCQGLSQGLSAEHKWTFEVGSSVARFDVALRLLEWTTRQGVEIGGVSYDERTQSLGFGLAKEVAVLLQQGATIEPRQQEALRAVAGFFIGRTPPLPERVRQIAGVGAPTSLTPADVMQLRKALDRILDTFGVKTRLFLP